LIPLGWIGFFPAGWLTILLLRVVVALTTMVMIRVLPRFSASQTVTIPAKLFDSTALFELTQHFK
jgi:uncharacterized membrane protein YjjP (DUF1212 family)